MEPCMRRQLTIDRFGVDSRMMLVEIHICKLKTAFESFTCGFIMVGISDVVAICVLLFHAFECVDCVLVAHLTNESLECVHLASRWSRDGSSLSCL